MVGIFTIGYEGATLHAFLSALEANQIEHVVDVRLTPFSRRPEFCRDALQRALHARGIRYSHVPELGCPKDIRIAYYENGDFGWYSSNYEQRVLSRRQDRLSQLARDARERRVCLLCLEADAHTCHRSLVAVAAAGINQKVFALEHLLVAS
jgi:uncharacterized protein (DUF488 family)